MLPQKLAAEFIGTLFLVAGVIGSGIAAERLSDDVGLQLLENAFATSGVLLALILALGPVSGAHFNPAVSVAETIYGRLPRGRLAPYLAAQMTGGFAGALLANAMFDLDLVSIAETDRSGAHILLAEGVATFGLLMVIAGVVAIGRPTLAAATVAGYIGAAYWFTSSTSFANPAVAFARMFSDTFTGIRPADAVAFIGVELIVAVIGALVLSWLFAGLDRQPHR